MADGSCSSTRSYRAELFTSRSRYEIGCRPPFAVEAGADGDAHAPLISSAIRRWSNAVECAGAKRRPLKAVTLSSPARQPMREPGYRQDRVPDTAVTPPRQKRRHYRADGVLVAIDWMPDRHETSCFGE